MAFGKGSGTPKMGGSKRGPGLSLKSDMKLGKQAGMGKARGSAKKSV